MCALERAELKPANKEKAGYALERAELTLINRRRGEEQRGYLRQHQENNAINLKNL